MRLLFECFDDVGWAAKTVKTEWWGAGMSGARCRFAYGPGDATATDCLLLQEIQIGFGFTFLVLAHPGSPGQNPESYKRL